MENQKDHNVDAVSRVVMLIEDEDIVMEVGRAMMEKMGYSVIEAATGQIAVDAANDPGVRFDLVLMDMDMPDMKGPEIFDRLTAARPGVKVIVCSGQSEDESVDDLMARGVHDFLQKPFSYKNLEAILVRHLDRRHEPRVRTQDNFLSVSGDKGIRNIRIVDISRGGLAFVCDEKEDDRNALIDVAVIMADKGVNLDDLECRIVSDRTLDPNDPETGEAMKRIGVSFGKMTKEQFDRLSALISVCSGAA